MTSENGADYGLSFGRTRLPYGATPLGSPWRTADTRGEGGYFVGASERIEDHVAERMPHLLIGDLDLETEEGVVPQIELDNDQRVAIKMAHFVLGSLLAIHVHRADYHFENDITLGSHDLELLDAAQRGLASPAEMFELLKQNPHVSSMELAKLTHVFSKDSLDELAMRASIDDIIRSYGDDARVLRDNYRTKLERIDPLIPACIVTCKSDRADLYRDGNVIRIVERRTLLVRGDDGILSTRSLNPVAEHVLSYAKNQKDQGFEILAEIVVDELKKPVEKQSSSLQPTTTSFYAHYR